MELLASIPRRIYHNALPLSIDRDVYLHTFYFCLYVCWCFCQWLLYRFYVRLETIIYSREGEKMNSSGYGHGVSKTTSKRTKPEFLKDVSLGVVGLLSLPFAYIGRMLMFALAIIYVCSREGWVAGKKI